MPRKILRIMIWANGAVSVLLIFSLLVAWTSAFYPYNLRLLWLVTQFGIKCVLLLPILGICMVVTEILSRRNREPTSSGCVSGGQSHTEDSA